MSGFQIGTLIEVRSDEEGFKGAWYKAKLINGPKHNKCVVEYTDLIEREDGTELLTETVDVSFIRPVPPSPVTKEEVIEVGLVVDAVVRDGWWTGVVVEVGEGGNKFLVAFDDPFDKIVVDRKDLRVHFDWVDGKWEKPPKKDTKTLVMLTRKSVNSNRHQRRGRKQHARKLSSSTGKKNNKVSVEDIVEKGCITVEGDVPVKELRGALSSEVHETPEKKDQQEECRDQDINTAERDISTRRKRGRAKLLEIKLTGEGRIGADSSLRQGVAEVSCGVGEAELSAGKDCLNIMTCENKPNEDHSQPTDKDNMKSVTADKILPSGLRRHNESVNETENISLADDHMDEAVVIKRLKRPKKSLLSEGSIGAKGSLRQMVVKDSCVIDEAGLSAGNDCLNVMTRDDKPNEAHSQPTNEGNLNTITADKERLSGLRGHTGLVNETENISLAGDHADAAVARRILKRPKKYMLSEGSIGADISPRQRVVEDLCIMNEAELSAGNGCLNITRCEDGPNEDDSQPASEDNTKSITADKKLLTGLRRHNELVNKTENISLAGDHVDEAVARKRLKRLKKSVLCESEEMNKVVGSDSRCQDAVSGTTSDSHEIHGEKKDDEAQILIDGAEEDQPLSTWLKEKPVPLVTDDSRALLVQHQCTNANGRQDDSGPPVATTDSLEPSPLQKILADKPKFNVNCGELGTPLAVVSSPTVSNGNMNSNQTLPFVKSSPVWNFLESMEILRKTPQKPHFSPLLKCREHIREGLAIGYIVTFSNLLENASNLKFSDPRRAIVSRLETLAELEAHGFDVCTVRARLTELLSRKERGRELQAQFKDIGNKISNIALEKAGLEKEINLVYDKLKVLEKMAEEVKSRKDEKEKRFLELQSKQNVVQEEILALQRDYESIVESLS